MKQVFSTKANIYNARFIIFNLMFSKPAYLPQTYGLNLVPTKANQLWNLLPEILKSPPSLTLFKNEKTGRALIVHITYATQEKNSGFHHMGDVWFSPTISHNLARCYKTHRMKGAWGNCIHIFLVLRVLFFCQVTLTYKN